MERAKRLLSTLEHLVSSKGKRHLVGGILLSASLFLGGLAMTVMSTKNEEIDDEESTF